MNDIIPLSPIDHVFTGRGSYPIEFIFYYEGMLDEGILRASLKDTLKYFPAVSSKLIRISGDTYGLKFSESGLEFNATEMTGRFSGFRNRSVFIDPVESFEDQPLTRIRLTRLSAGSVLGVSISHAVADGFSYFYFLSAWSKVFRGLSIIPPDHSRELLRPETESKHLKPGYDEVFNKCGLFMLGRRNEFSRENQKWDKIIYKTDELKSMVGQAQSESPLRLSVNDIVTARFWKEYGLRWTPEDQDIMTYVSCPVDFRRIFPGFPGNYFGDGLCLATSALKREDLPEMPVSGLAAAIRSSVARVNETFIRSSMETLETVRKQNGLGIMENIHVVHPVSGLLVTNLSRLPVNELIFNCGPPAASDILTTAQRGAVILPAEDGLEIRVCLPS